MAVKQKFEEAAKEQVQPELSDSTCQYVSGDSQATHPAKDQAAKRVDEEITWVCEYPGESRC